MWARNIEFMLGIWMVLSPFIFAHAEPPAAVVWTDVGTAFAICVVSLVCYYPASRKLHLVNGVIGLAYIVYAFLGPQPPPPYHQNHVIVGLLLMMLCVVPNRASEPARKWREFYDEEP